MIWRKLPGSCWLKSCIRLLFPHCAKVTKHSIFLCTELVLCQEDLRNQQGQVKELSLRICCQEQKHLFKLDFITPFTKSRSPFWNNLVSEDARLGITVHFSINRQNRFNFGVDLGDYNFTWLSNCVILNLVFSCSILEGITLTLKQPRISCG